MPGDQPTDERQAALNAYWAANTPAEETAAMDRMLSLGMLRGDEEQLASRFPGLVSRREVMDLIEAEIPLHSEDTPPRHALSILWGKVRDMMAAKPDG